jgi:hypothetical protein
MRKKRRLLLLFSTGLVCIAATAATAASAPVDLRQSYVIAEDGQLFPLQAHGAYTASLFPVRVRITPSVRGWRGAQWRSGTEYFHGGGPPNFGWIHFSHRYVGGIPQGLISIMTAYAKTPSVAATVDVLRTRGRGATYDPSVPVKVAGFSGVEFDGTIAGAKNVDHIGHYFIPFSAKSAAAKYYPDEYPVYGDVFRVMVLDVRGKTVVVYIENVGLAPARFPQFLAQADQLLESLRFPR